MTQVSEGDDALAAELLGLGAATVGEAGGLVMSPRIHALWRGAKVCSRAFPVRCVSGDNLAIHAGVARAPRSSVLVASVGEQESFGYWGEVLTTAAQARDIRGLVIEGCVRDVDALEQRDFPVFATGIALRGAAKVGGGAVGTEVVVGGVRVGTGDWVLGDSDGVVVVQRDEIGSVAASARARAEKEKRMFAELRAGRTTVELLGLDVSVVEDTTPTADRG